MNNIDSLEHEGKGQTQTQDHIESKIIFSGDMSRRCSCLLKSHNSNETVKLTRALSKCGVWCK